MQIHWTHFDEIEPAERAGIETRLESLAEGHSDLIDLRLVGSVSGHHRHGLKEVRLTCQIRGKELVVTRERDELSRALHDVVDAFEGEVRRLRERRRERRNEQRALPPYLGLVDRVFHGDGYGFVLTDSGEQVYFHHNAVSGGLIFEQLKEGLRVGLNVEAGAKGPQATAVYPAPADAPAP
jgi:cold shock CspA family protein/ribosome-associated translation inhibitor RaiA